MDKQQLAAPTDVAFQLGWSSAKSDLDMDSNPYADVNLHQYTAWCNGWQHYQSYIQGQVDCIDILTSTIIRTAEVHNLQQLTIDNIVKLLEACNPATSE